MIGEKLLENMQLNDPTQNISILFSLTVLKLLHAMWVESAFNKMSKSNLSQCWSNTGILQMIDSIRNEIKVVIDWIFCECECFECVIVLSDTNTVISYLHI